MNEYIADMLAQHFSTLPFLDRVGGCVTKVTKTVKRKRITYPAALDVYPAAADCDAGGTYYSLVPDSKETGIMYFEDMGAKRVKGTRHYGEWKGTLRAVCWWNFKLIGSAVKPGNLANAVLAHMPGSVAPDGNIIAATVWAASTDPGTTSPFAKYSFADAEKQLTTHPYGSFSFTVEYKARVSVNCPINITLNPDQC